MKDFIISILRKLLTIGNDKLLHALFGVVIAEVTMLLPLSLHFKCLAAFLVVSSIEMLKETVIDSHVDWHDVIATILGCLIGIGLTVLNIIL